MDIPRVQTGFLEQRVYASLDEIERMAPRKVDYTAATENAYYYYDGEKWALQTMRQYITFKVVSRHYITGRGHVTVVYNPDLLPIDRDRSAVCKGQFRLPIHGIEIEATLMEHPRVKPNWGLVTSEETIGDYLTVRMYPDEADEQVSADRIKELLK